MKFRSTSLGMVLLLVTSILGMTTLVAAPANALITDLASLTITPATSNVTVGTAVTYTATGVNGLGLSLGLYTLLSTFSLGAGNGSCLLNVCTPTKAGPITVTATSGSVTATATINASAGPAASLTLAPTSSTIDATLFKDFTASAADAYGNSLGDVTGSTTFTIDSGTCATARCSSTTPGTRTVTGHYGSLSATAQLTITKSTLQIAASNVGAPLTYGDPIPTVTPAYSGFVNGGTVASAVTTAPTCVTSYTSTTHPGSYPTGNTCSGAVAPAYNVAYAAGSYVVAKKVLTVTAPSTSAVYGGSVSLTPVYSGFVNGDTAASLATAPTCTADTSAVGTSATICSGGVDANYSFTYVNGTATIAKRTLTVTASSVSSVYGATPGAAMPTYSGFASGESASNLTTVPTCSSTATSASAAGGSYVTTCQGGASSSYAFAYATGIATITKRPVTVTAPSSTRVFGSTPAVSLTPTISGLINGDTFTTLPVCTTTTDVYANVGTYPVVCTPGTTGSNYQPTAINGVLTVTSAPLTVRAPTLDKVWGAVIPTLTPSYEGLLNGPVQTAATCTTTATFISLLGSYPVTCSGAADPTTRSPTQQGC